MCPPGGITLPCKAGCAESKGNRVLNTTATSPDDPWHEDLPVCRVYSHSPRFRQLLESYVGDVVKFTASPETAPREALLVDCTETADILRTARAMFPRQPIIAVVADSDTGRIIETLTRGPDGVIAMTDPPRAWRECLHVVLGGGRWVGGPGLDVSLEQKYAYHDIATHDLHTGEVTVRTQLFMRDRLADKPGDKSGD
jgi:DNA-binding NarL/FixJ family response regulator